MSVLKYETPDMEVIYFKTEDILTESTGEGEEPWTGEGEEPW